MTALMLFSTTEHFLVLSAFLFPPVLIIVLLVVLLATFGKSLGLRERYVSILLRIFEWGAGEIQSSQQHHHQYYTHKKMSFELGATASDAEDEDFALPENSDAGHYCSLDLSSTQSPSADSGFMPGSPLARSANSLTSLRKSSSAVHHGSTTSLCSASSARVRHSSGQSIIIRETAIHLDEDEYTEKTMVNSRGWQVIRDSLYFMKAGVEAVIEDEVTSRFQAEQLASWNMLTRTSVNFYKFVSWKLTMLWVLGFLFRYFFLLPMRFIVFSVSIITVVLGTAVVGLFPNGRVKRWMNEKLMLVCMRIASRAFSALIYFHDAENRAESGGICVANHTSPIDVVILGTDTAYALIGQQHSGILGAIQRALSRASSHIWFERSEARDRSLVAKRLHDHVQDPKKLPVLIFPEGTCINVNYEFTRIKSRITTLKEMENKQLSQPTFSADDSQQATPEQTKIKELTDEITKMFGHTRRLIRLLEDESHSQLESHEKMRQNVITSLMLSLNTLMNEFRSIQSNYLRHLDSNNNLDVFLVKSCSSGMQTDLSGINLAGEDGTEEPELSIDQLQQIIENEHMTKEREHEILRISKSILEMNSLFRDIATMIVDQGAILDRIDYNCEQSASRIKEAFKSVEKAEKYQRKNKKMHLIVVLAGFAIFLMLLIILIKF